jgi:hypothetical protein
MATERDDAAERLARLEKMIEEFRAARARRLVKRGIALWNRTVAEGEVAITPEPPPVLIKH